MKKTICCILLVSSAFAQTTGEAADVPVQAAKSNAWKGWVFAGAAIVIAAGAIVAVAVSEGATPQQH